MLRPLLLTSALVTLPACAFAQTDTPNTSHTLAATLRADIARLQAERDVAGVGVVIVSGNEIILADGFGATLDGTPVTANTACGLYSATKALTAFTLASLVDDGLVDINATIAETWDGAPEHWSAIPVWRLYNHTSGIPMIVNQPEFGSLASDPEAGNEAIIDIVAQQPLDYDPGEYSRYRQSGYGLAEWMIHQNTGQSWPELVDAHLAAPAGASATRHSQMASGEKTVPMLTSAGFYETSPRDMGAIFQALNSGRIASRETLTGLLMDPAYVHGNYGLGLIHETVVDTNTIGHRGGGARGNIRYAPEAGIGVMACTDQQPNGELTIDIAERAITLLLTGEFPVEAEE
jgi:CubicO group peptidase (beta-lactamase class C family)